MYCNTFLIPLIAVTLLGLFSPVAAIPAPDGEVEAAAYNPNNCKKYCVYKGGDWHDKEGKKWRDPYCRDWCKPPKCDPPRDCRKHDVPYYCRGKCPQCHPREDCFKGHVPWYCDGKCPRCNPRKDCDHNPPWYCKGKCHHDED